MYSKKGVSDHMHVDSHLGMATLCSDMLLLQPSVSGDTEHHKRDRMAHEAVCGQKKRDTVQFVLVAVLSKLMLVAVLSAPREVWMRPSGKLVHLFVSPVFFHC